MREFIAFSPEQVKSATANRGTVDGTNPDITYQLRSVDGRQQGRVDEGMLQNAQAQFPVAEISGEEIGPRSMDTKSLRAKARQWYEDNLRDSSVINLASGWEIKFRGADKSFSYSANPDKLRLFAALKAVIERGEIKNSEPPKDPSVENSTIAYHWLEAPVLLNGEVVTVGVTIREDANGNLYYNHNPIEKASASELGRPPHKDGPGTKTDASGGQKSTSAQDVNLEVKAAPSPTYQLRPLNQAGAANQKAVKKQQVFEASGVPQTLLQEIDARLERIRARQIGQEDLSRAAQPVAVATREADLMTRGVRKALGKESSKSCDELTPRERSHIARLVSLCEAECGMETPALRAVTSFEELHGGEFLGKSGKRNSHRFGLLAHRCE